MIEKAKQLYEKQDSRFSWTIWEGPCKFFQFFRLPFLSKQTLSLIREGLGYKNVVQLLQFKRYVERFREKRMQERMQDMMDARNIAVQLLNDHAI